ncbi:hypothetical protein [Leisingera daeponensis]|uniref:hypothetical protein n=1 Tax=Leisingera daeponensis TaxID=405746 RepID=UPI001C9689EC|nr:hypothetical protein [Leisingera daeponensis]MBY6058172.1 hypothetical protein [Leisingera daeponensis]
MPAPKGSRNARAYQEAQVSRNLALVRGTLSKLRAVRAKFDSITALSQAVALETGLSDVTLRRNKSYRILIIEYINQQGGRSGYQSRYEAEMNQLRHKVTELELRLGNVMADNERLRAFAKNVSDSENSSIVNLPKVAVTSGNEDLGTFLDESHIRTFHLVEAIVSRAFFEINFDRNTIEDSTGIEEDEIVAGPNLAEPFIEWCRSRRYRNG